VAPLFTPKWGDIPAKGSRIHPQAMPVAFCCQGKMHHEILLGRQFIPEGRGRPGICRLQQEKALFSYGESNYGELGFNESIGESGSA